MPFLLLQSLPDGVPNPFWCKEWYKPDPSWFNYQWLAEGFSLYRQWLNDTDGCRQSTLTDGILADWLDDHRDELLTGATGPYDPALRLQQLIDYLRQRFRSQ